jgi:glutathione S-transferase
MEFDVHDDHILTFLQRKLSFANSWIQYGVFTNRAILSYGGPFNGLGPGSNWPQASLDVFLQEGAMRAEKSLKILEQHLKAEEWLALGRPTVADLSVFVYVALAHMGDISLEPYPGIRKWIGRIKGLKGFFGIEGLDDPMVLRR